MNKKVLPLFIIFIILFSQTSCWNSREVNNLAIAICLGLDKQEDGILLSVQVLKSKAIAGEESVNEGPVILYSQKGKDIEEAMIRLSTKIPKMIYNAHVRVIVFGEELARQGITEFLDYFTREHEFRTDFYFSVAYGTTAHMILKTITPLVSIPGISIFDSIKLTEEIWASTKSIRIIELVNSLISEGTSPVLTGIRITGNLPTSDNVGDLTQIEPRNFLSLDHLAIIDDDKLVGWLNEDESIGFNYITGNVKGSTQSILYKDQRASLQVLSSESDIKPKLENNKLAMEVKIKIIESFESVTEKIDVTDKEAVSKISAQCEKDIKNLCIEVINKAKKERCDIFGFGDEVHRKYKKRWSTIKKDWDRYFSKMPVHLDVNVEIKGLGAISKSYFTKEED